MDTRIALIGIILESRESVDALNHLLTEFGEYIIGRITTCSLNLVSTTSDGWESPTGKKGFTLSVWRWMPLIM